MRVEVSGVLGNGVTAKDITLTIIGKMGTAGGTGHVMNIAEALFKAFPWKDV